MPAVPHEILSKPVIVHANKARLDELDFLATTLDASRAALVSRGVLWFVSYGYAEPEIILEAVLNRGATRDIAATFSVSPEVALEVTNFCYDRELTTSQVATGGLAYWLSHTMAQIPTPVPFDLAKDPEQADRDRLSGTWRTRIDDAVQDFIEDFHSPEDPETE